ncbi:hypothetical protein AB0L13_22000 [Saccharopolyspora shandongensis]
MRTARELPDTNVFHDPRSLAGAVEFFRIPGPADFFPPMGP